MRRTRGVYPHIEGPSLLLPAWMELLEGYHTELPSGFLIQEGLLLSCLSWYFSIYSPSGHHSFPKYFINLSFGFDLYTSLFPGLFLLLVCLPLGLWGVTVPSPWCTGSPWLWSEGVEVTRTH